MKKNKPISLLLINLFQNSKPKILNRFKGMARGFLLLTTFLFATALVLTTLTNLTYPKSLFDETKIEILRDPQNSPAKLFLAQQLFSTNQFQTSEKILSSLISANKNAAFSQSVQKELDKIHLVALEPEKVNQKINFWEKTLEEFPYYRDAYIELAILNWKIYRVEEAKSLLQKGLLIDPNSEVIRKLLAVIK